MKVVLCRGEFSDEYAERVRAAVPRTMQLTETVLHYEFAAVKPKYAAILFGTRQTEKMESVQVKISATNHMYYIHVSALEELLLTQLRQGLQRQSQPSSQPQQLSSSPSGYLPQRPA